MKRLLTTAAALFLVVAADQASASPGWASGNVNLRQGAGTSYGKITTVPYCAPLEVYGCNYGWCQVLYQGYQGYVSQGYIRYSPCASYGGGGSYQPPSYGGGRRY
jgi:uncharacterized protein YraI